MGRFSYFNEDLLENVGKIKSIKAYIETLVDKLKNKSGATSNNRLVITFLGLHLEIRFRSYIY